MSPVTNLNSGKEPLDFQSTNHLSGRAAASLDVAFSRGWLDPSKIHHGSAELRNLLEESRESIAANLGVEKKELEFVGELGFAYWAALSGFLADSSRTFIHSETDRQVVHAFTRQHRVRGGKALTLPVSADGQADFSSCLDQESHSVVFWQRTNRESGVLQGVSDLEKVPSGSHSLIADLTACFYPKSLPKEWSVALWDPRTYSGPEGIAIVAIREGSSWRSPIPEIDKRRLFGAFSKPLLILTAIALEEYSSNLEEKERKLLQLNSYLISRLRDEISGLRIAGETADRDPHLLAVAIDGVIAEELLREMEQREILIDAGSACGAGALSPSHVLSAMGLGLDGHIRFTIRPEQGLADIDSLITNLKETVEKAREQS